MLTGIDDYITKYLRGARSRAVPEMPAWLPQDVRSFFEHWNESFVPSAMVAGHEQLMLIPCELGSPYAEYVEDYPSLAGIFAPEQPVISFDYFLGGTWSTGESWDAELHGYERFHVGEGNSIWHYYCHIDGKIHVEHRFDAECVVLADSFADFLDMQVYLQAPVAPVERST